MTHKNKPNKMNIISELETFWINTLLKLENNNTTSENCITTLRDTSLIIKEKNNIKYTILLRFIKRNDEKILEAYSVNLDIIKIEKILHVSILETGIEPVLSKLLIIPCPELNILLECLNKTS